MLRILLYILISMALIVVAYLIGEHKSFTYQRITGLVACTIILIGGYFGIWKKMPTGIENNMSSDEFVSHHHPASNYSTRDGGDEDDGPRCETEEE